VWPFQPILVQLISIPFPAIGITLSRRAAKEFNIRLDIIVPGYVP
jgi:hypothetical protein